MDIVAACNAFVSVSDRGSFTIGAAAAGMQQSVASRRIAALENHLGEALFDRATRRPQLTPFGRGMLTAARGVTVAAAEFEAQARRSRSSVLRFAVPESPPRARGAFIAAGRDAGLNAEVMSGDPAAREDAFASGAAQAAIVPDAAERAMWAVPLGVATAATSARPFLLSSLRPRRSDAGKQRRLLYAAEDDLPQIRDVLTAFRDAHALAPAQLALTEDVPGAVADVIAGDVLLCTRSRAADLGLFWSPVADAALARTYTLVTAVPDLVTLLGTEALRRLARLLGEEVG